MSLLVVAFGPSVPTENRTKVRLGLLQMVVIYLVEEEAFIHPNQCTFMYFESKLQVIGENICNLTTWSPETVLGVLIIVVINTRSLRKRFQGLTKPTNDVMIFCSV